MSGFVLVDVIGKMRGRYRAGHREPAEGERFGKGKKKVGEVSQLLQGEEFERTELLKEDIKKCSGIFCNFFLLYLPQELPFQVNICIASSSLGLVILKKEKGKTSPKGGSWCQLQIIQINVL